MDLEMERLERGEPYEHSFEPDLSHLEYDIIEPALTNEPYDPNRNYSETPF